MAKQDDKERIRQACETLSAELLKLTKISRTSPEPTKELDLQIKKVEELLRSDVFFCADPQLQHLGPPKKR